MFTLAMQRHWGGSGAFIAMIAMLAGKTDLYLRKRLVVAVMERGQQVEILENKLRPHKTKTRGKG